MGRAPARMVARVLRASAPVLGPSLMKPAVPTDNSCHGPLGVAASHLWLTRSALRKPDRGLMDERRRFPSTRAKTADTRPTEADQRER